MTLELEAIGNGQANLDNFEIAATVNSNPVTAKQFGDWQFNTFTRNSDNQAATNEFIA